MNGSFYGWYLKCQSQTQTLAVIPAVHEVGRERTCSIQVITQDGAWTAEFPGEEFCGSGSRRAIEGEKFRQKVSQRSIGEHRIHHNRKCITIGENHFSEKGIRMEISTPDLSVKGTLRFGPLIPLKYDIMGPFALMPFMECRHMVYSMKHSVEGKVYINGKEYFFQNALGYWEGDRGSSFPKEYLWTQCFFSGGSLMLSVADIPIADMHFTGMIGVILWKGREYRLATYLGARIVKIHDRMVQIVQGDLEVEAWLLEANPHPLNAPTNGNMVRMIHESATCRALYQFRQKGRTIFAFETDRASFEYEYSV